MRVTVWRHGEAAAATTDALRPLTVRGRDSVQSAARAFSSEMQVSGTPITVCRYSPLVRTTETAEVIGDVIDDLVMQVCDALAPGASVTDCDRFLPQDAAHVVLVSHQPFVSALISYWLDDESLPFLSPGGYMCVDLLAPTRGGATAVSARPALF